MAESTTPDNEAFGQRQTGDVPGLDSVDPRQAFRTALARYSTPRLAAIVTARELVTEAARPTTLASDLTAQLDSPAVISRQLDGLSTDSHHALSLFALTETTTSSVAGISHALATLGVDPRSTILELLERGLLAIDTEAEGPAVDDFGPRLDHVPDGTIRLRVHPAVPRLVRAPKPGGRLEASTSEVIQVRESDGLEPILRLAALWQRVGVEPLRQTQQGALYKRDHERLEEDPALADPVSDAPAPLAALPSLWLALALRVGIVRRDPAGDRLEAAAPEDWADNAVHLPQMIATSWLGLQGWRELGPSPGDLPDRGLPAAHLRPVILLWLACLGDEEWIALDDLAAHLRSTHPRWDRTSFREDEQATQATGRRARTRGGSAEAKSHDVLGSMLLGAGFAMGLVRVATDKLTSRQVVQLTALGRYALAMGPPPPPRPSFDHFLFVQPNLEIIAYRQGLTPQLVGRLSRFAWWTKLGAALELKLTQESINFGLGGGLSADEMLGVLTRHSSRPLPTLVPDAVRRWADRREQISVYTAATLMEFGSTEERDLALAAWEPGEPKTFVPVADRFLLVENAAKIPTDRIRSGGARDYRHPPEKCISIEPDGITLVLDPMRSDLLIDAELARISDELPAYRPSTRAGISSATPRRFIVTTASLKRAGDMGISATQILEWFDRRTSEGASPAIRLLLRATTGSSTPLSTRRMLVLTIPSKEFADGMLQHPETREFLGERLGPTTVAVPEGSVESLRRILESFGFRLTSS